MSKLREITLKCVPDKESIPGIWKLEFRVDFVDIANIAICQKFDQMDIELIKEDDTNSLLSVILDSMVKKLKRELELK